MSDELTDLLTFAPGREYGSDEAGFGATISATFTIGPKVHGGTVQMLTAKAAVEGLRALSPDAIGDDVVPVAISTEYLWAPDPGPVELVARVRKRGRRISVVDVDLTQGGRVAASTSTTLGIPDSGRPRYLSHNALHDLPSEPSADALDGSAGALGEVIHLADAVSLFVDPTSVPFMAGKTGMPLTRLWARPRSADPDAYFAILSGDLSMPVVMNLGLLGWAPTMQLTTYLRHLPAPGWLRISASSDYVGLGWFSEEHLIIDSAGTVVAESRQLALLPD